MVREESWPNGSTTVAACLAENPRAELERHPGVFARNAGTQERSDKDVREAFSVSSERIHMIQYLIRRLG